MTSSERIDCNPGVARRLKSPPKPGQKSVFLAERFPSIPDGCEGLPLPATSRSLPVTPRLCVFTAWANPQGTAGSSVVGPIAYAASPEERFRTKCLGQTRVFVG